MPSPQRSDSVSSPTPRPLVIACAALANDLRAVLRSAGLGALIEVVHLPANLHNTPQHIVPSVRPHLQRATAAGRAVFVAYADCGTGGLLDALLAEHPGVRRLPGSHCYEFFTGSTDFAALHDAELGTFYLTDFLAKHFDALIWGGLGLDRHPELLDVYFSHYTRLVLLAQTDDDAVSARAAKAAERLGLRFERRFVGRNGLGHDLGEWAALSIRKAAS